MTSPGSNEDHRWMILAILGVAQLMVVLDATVVNIALPVRPARPRLLQRRPPVDRHRLLARLRQPAAARRPARRPVRPQVHLRRSASSASPLASAAGGAAHELRRCSSRRAPCRACSARCSRPRRSRAHHDLHRARRARARHSAIFGAIAGAGGAIGLLLGGVLTAGPRLALEPSTSTSSSPPSPSVGAATLVPATAPAAPTPEARRARHPRRRRPALFAPRLRLLARARRTSWSNPDDDRGLLAAAVVLLVAFVASGAARRASAAAAAACVARPQPGRAPTSSIAHRRRGRCSRSSCSSPTTCRRPARLLADPDRASRSCR